jgi:hypothetical protein
MSGPEVESTEGGMSGAAGEGGFSAQGNGGPNSSSASEKAPLEFIDPAELEGAIVAHPNEVGDFLLETGGAAIEFLEHGLHFTNPIMLAPIEELNGPVPDKA